MIQSATKWDVWLQRNLGSGVTINETKMNIMHVSGEGETTRKRSTIDVPLNSQMLTLLSMFMKGMVLL